VRAVSDYRSEHSRARIGTKYDNQMIFIDVLVLMLPVYVEKK
jgi:hypothetical protein